MSTSRDITRATLNAVHRGDTSPHHHRVENRYIELRRSRMLRDALDICICLLFTSHLRCAQSCPASLLRVVAIRHGAGEMAGMAGNIRQNNMVAGIWRNSSLEHGGTALSAAHILPGCVAGSWRPNTRAALAPLCLAMPH